MSTLLHQSYDGISHVEILNRSENVRFSSPRSAKSKGVSLNGALLHPVLGVSRSSDTLYLIAFDGRLTLPDAVTIHYKRGIDDLQKELVDTYAPSLSYGKLLETRKMARSLAPYADIPTADVMQVAHKFSDCTTRSFFAPQAELSAPPALERLERSMRLRNFRWNGQFGFLSQAAAGEIVMIPELDGARNADELWNKVMSFIVHHIYAKGGALSALVRELNKISLQDAQSLGNFILEIQPAIANAESQGEAFATTALQKAEGDLQEGLEELRKKKIPYASTMMKLYGGVAAPISHEQWEGLLAETAVQEIAAKSKGSKEAPGSKKVLKGETGVRSATNWEAALNGKKAFSMCLRGEAVSQLRLLAQANQNWAVDSYVRTATREQVKQWLTNATSVKTSVVGRFEMEQQSMSERVEFTPDRRRNSVQIRFTGHTCDQMFEEHARPSPSPSPSPTAPPTPSTGESHKGFWSDTWDWCKSWF